MSSSLHPSILIVGAGPTGLVLALRLARHGIPVRIIDRAAGPGEASRAMVVHARTLEFYQQLGFADEVVARGIRMGGVHLREEGAEVAAIRFGDLGVGISPFPFMLCFPQDDHERFLLARLTDAGVPVEYGTELVDLAEGETGVRAVLDRAGARETCEVAYLCGCDGAHSRVRQSLGIGFPGGTYRQLFYVADVHLADHLADQLGEDVFVNLGVDALGLVLPVRSSGMHRLIGIVPPHLAQRDDLSFSDVQPTAEPLLGVRVAAVNWFSTYHVHHRVAAQFRSGRCFIAGDAGHVHSPAGGQGMNTGIGDAVNLSWKLATVLRGRADPALLDTYEPERIAFARQLVASTDRAFEAVIGRGLRHQVLRTWLLPHLMPLLWGFSATRRMMFDIVSQVRIAYPHSALSRGRAGTVRGGDRLPWIPGPEGDNFAALRTLDWQLHVYGSVRPALADAAAALDLAVHAFAHGPAAAEAGMPRDAAILVRPDGHVALALPDQDAALLAAYARRHGLRFAGRDAVAA
ncbi:FAD-dependent monooxygenase [Methylobacterium nodulans]|uniref:Monooxygenase FAD-binding n=1 Tax=Methylobacterium nodulans (strain LMG 21967 / CNCM I-2342 / ORS 2060) TaxID=460265 RepID=B8IG81_METNO|nr:FAD-dependent monooxygenase [Methylobacterium nodulans]ACL61558.1 monooxygenase FAD-binding [Methylobacterium nodulans ORS 2060]